MDLPISNLPEENSCGCNDTESSASNECMCPATGLVQIIGRKYALRLLTVIGERQQIRFNDLKTCNGRYEFFDADDSAGGTERAALIERLTYAETPPRVEYKLTTEGSKLRRSLFALSKYASRKPVASGRFYGAVILPLEDQAKDFDNSCFC